MITISGEPKEIAALVVALQERQISNDFVINQIVNGLEKTVDKIQ